MRHPSRGIVSRVVRRFSRADTTQLTTLLGFVRSLTRNEATAISLVVGLGPAPTATATATATAIGTATATADWTGRAPVERALELGVAADDGDQRLPLVVTCAGRSAISSPWARTSRAVSSARSMYRAAQ